MLNKLIGSYHPFYYTTTVFFFRFFRFLRIHVFFSMKCFIAWVVYQNWNSLIRSTLKYEKILTKLPILPIALKFSVNLIWLIFIHVTKFNTGIMIIYRPFSISFKVAENFSLISFLFDLLLYLLHCQSPWIDLSSTASFSWKAIVLIKSFKHL